MNHPPSPPADIGNLFSFILNEFPPFAIEVRRELKLDAILNEFPPFAIEVRGELKLEAN